MYEESLLIAHLATATGYTVEYADDSIKDMSALGETLPTIYVGHLGIKPFQESSEITIASGYASLESRNILSTSISFICARSNFVTVRTAIKNAYETFTVTDVNYSSLFLISGNVLAGTAAKIWYREVVGMIFPRVK